MRPFSSRCLQFAAALGLAAVALTGCGSGSASSPAAPPVSVTPGTVLKASGGYTGQVVGDFKCATTGDTTLVTLTAGGSLVVRAVGGKVAEGAYLGGGQDFGGTVTPAGQGGTVALTGSSATLTDVQIPSRNGGTPMVLNGTITCH